jgi:BirA family biotin operon repressor/biotin-[acetyl-CoA-carboxylase] ligase
MVEVVDEAASTQDVVRAWIAEGRPAGAALRARRQTEGRGRLGRVWEAAADEALLLSVLLRPALPPGRLGLVALAAAVAVREVCDARGARLGIKWPNDLLAPDGRKVAGILAEAEHHAGQVAVVLGVGVNVSAAPPGLPSACLAELGASVEIGAFAEAVAAAVVAWSDRLRRDPSAVLEAWRAGSVTLGRRVVSDGAEGVAVDIDADGALRLRTADGGERRVVAGDVLFAPTEDRPSGR